tara:strand:- start:52 stop:201 length:150 start_codon:yes stop_codon:yes gene_type:complete
MKKTAKEHFEHLCNVIGVPYYIGQEGKESIEAALKPAAKPAAGKEKKAK